MQKTWISAAAFLLALAVGLGALGAHGLKAVCTADQLDSFETGVRYQVWHCFGLILVQLLPDTLISSRPRRLVSWLFLVGIGCFSFSIYLLSLRSVLGIETLASVLGPVTPLGGLFLISGWVLLGGSLFRRKAVRE